MRQCLWKDVRPPNPRVAIALLTDTDDGKTFVRKQGLLAAVAPRPVRTAVANFLGAREETRPLRGGVVDAVRDHDTAHAARFAGLVSAGQREVGGERDGGSG